MADSTSALLFPRDLTSRLRILSSTLQTCFHPDNSDTSF
ncbi:unnamed protein product [Strongylus vulgaris]|uniref:Uncharacterized protein n=1 Tax=Strongylus vulgaris TaxID=40348 RepID=A0A3P7IX99_STRVU|nr:unnamed protein product [Strongylus vulgaris]